jgi:PEP-CTERM motif
MRQILRHISHAALGGFLAIQGILVALTPAQADVVQFAARGTFADGGVLSGLITIDTTVGQATAINVFADGFFMKEIVTQPSEDTEFTLVASPGDSNAQLSLVFGISLIGYTYGALELTTRFDDFAADPPTHTFLLIGVVQPFSGTTSAPSAPEPSTWTLMIVGFAAVGFFAVRRAGKATAATIA